MVAELRKREIWSLKREKILKLRVILLFFMWINFSFLIRAIHVILLELGTVAKGL